jgi:maltose O-acetyltransferase
MDTKHFPFPRPGYLFTQFIYYLLNCWVMIIPSHTIRLNTARRFLASLGSGCSFLIGCQFRAAKNIFIGNNCVFNKEVLLDGRGGCLIIGNCVEVAQETNIWTLEHDVHDELHKDCLL